MAKGSPTEACVQLGRDIKVLRIKAGLTQTELVEKSEGALRIGTVIAIENGKYNAGIAQMLTYCEVLGYKVQFVEK